jgi:serine/threonine-protein kinase
MSEPSHLTAGPAGRYELRHQVGEGGSGTVFKAWDTQLQRFVAFKRLKNPDLTENADVILQEAKTLAALQHPNILTVFDCGADEQGAYVVTEFLEGEPLDEMVRETRFEAGTVGEPMVQILEGLIAAHHMHVIHRDLKPSNIMVISLPSGARQYKILDFGLARIMNRPTTQTMYDDRTVYGSIYYFAPEQIKRRPLDERTDLYALGCVFYFMLTGEQAFQGDSLADIITSHLEHRFTPLREARPDLPADLCAWVSSLMAADQDERPASAKVALDRVRPILARLGRPGSIRLSAANVVRPAVGNQTMSIPMAPFSRRRRLALMAGVVLTAGLLGGFVLLRPEPPPRRLSTCRIILRAWIARISCAPTSTALRTWISGSIAWARWARRWPLPCSATATPARPTSTCCTPSATRAVTAPKRANSISWCGSARPGRRWKSTRSK